MLGFQPYSLLMKEAYKHHIFISPSITASDGDTEGGAPVTIIEMAATGMPIVSTRHCDIPEVVEDGVTGFLAPERDVNGLISNIQWLLKNNLSWEPILSAGRKKVEIEFDVHIQSEKLGIRYRNISNH